MTARNLIVNHVCGGLLSTNFNLCCVFNGSDANDDQNF